MQQTFDLETGEVFNEIAIGKQVYKLPYAKLLPDLSPSEYDELRADIAERGVIVPIILDEHSNVIDGQHRLKVAADLGLENVPIEIRPSLTNDEKEQLAWDLNAHRRQMTKEKRLEYEKTLLTKGLSINLVADKLGVDPSTVHSDIKDEPTIGKSIPEKVTGKDGKKYPAKQQSGTRKRGRKPLSKPVRAYSLKDAVDISHAVASIPDDIRAEVHNTPIIDNKKHLEKFAQKPPEDQRRIVEIMSEGKAKTFQAAERLFSQDTRKKAAQSLPDKVFNVIYADPAWPYNNTGVHGAAEGHYRTMTVDDICTLPATANLHIADHAVLFMWATNPTLPDAFKVVEAWGFEYKTNMAWVKTDLVKPGSGFYVRGRHELLFICTRGSFLPLVDVSPPIGSVIYAPIGEHSAKPDEFYTIIEQLYPGCNYVELFARRPRINWYAWGDDDHLTHS